MIVTRLGKHHPLMVYHKMPALSTEIYVIIWGIQNYTEKKISVLYEKEDTHSSDLTSENVMLGDTENVSSDGIVSQDNNAVNDCACTDTENVVRLSMMGDKYYGHTIGKNFLDIKLEPLAWNSEEKIWYIP